MHDQYQQRAGYQQAADLLPAPHKQTNCRASNQRDEGDFK
jgi:hypothetical protein